MYKKGSLDRVMVQQIQRALNVNADGIYGLKTETAVRNFQSNEGLVADGIVGPKTLEALGVLDTDKKQVLSYKTETGLHIIKHHLPKTEYIQNEEPILNDYLFLHHTAGWNNPYNCIDGWGRDSRGRIATEFVIGGQNIKDGDKRYDGEVLQAFPESCQGWHLGATGSYYMNRHSVGIELCSFGYLDDEGRTYTGSAADISQIVELDKPFKDRTLWHKYSDAQLKALRKLILHVANRDNIDICNGLQKWIESMGPVKAFDFQQNAYEGNVKGLLTHTNVRIDKTDCFPQQELVDMILSL